VRPNGVRALWREGKPAIGALLSTNSPLLAEAISHLGFDWLVVDLQHSETNLAQIQPMLTAVSTTSVMPLVRVAGNDSILIQRVLDLGAYGVLVPMVNTVAEAEAAVRAAKYPPRGRRSWGPIRGSIYAGSDYFQHANEELIVMAMLETEEGVRNTREILSVDGIDGCFIGPNDLGVSYGYPPESGVSPEVDKVIQTVLDACHATGTVGGIQTYGPESAIQRVEQGFRFVGMGTDIRFAVPAAREALAATREGISRERR
jgi:4-hydroxy-2-oxoheptanedioate aldolase